MDNDNFDYVINDQLIDVRVNYAIRNFFKNFFKTASWNATKKKWIIKNTRTSLNKLKKFEIIINSKIEKTDLLDEDDMTYEAIRLLELDIETLTKQVYATRVKYKKKADLLNELENLNLKTREIEIKIEDKINKIVDVNAIDKALSQCAAGMTYVRKADKLALIQHNIKFLEECVEKLKEAGFKSISLLQAIDVNINRPDKYNFNRYRDLWLDQIKKI